MSAIALPSLSSEDNLYRYFREVWSFPMLDADTEQMLALNFRDHKDLNAAHQLVTSHLRLVCKIAAGYRGYGLPVADLISEGNIGLMKAVKNLIRTVAFVCLLMLCGGLKRQLQSMCLNLGRL